MSLRVWWKRARRYRFPHGIPRANPVAEGFWAGPSMWDLPPQDPGPRPWFVSEALWKDTLRDYGWTVTRRDYFGNPVWSKSYTHQESGR